MSPLARPVATQLTLSAARPNRDAQLVTSPNDQRQSLMFSPAPPTGARPKRRLSAAGLSDLERLMSEEDRDLLIFVQEVRVATGAQLRRVMAPSDANAGSRARTARRRLQRLGEWRVLDRVSERSAGGPGGGSDSYRWHVGPAGRRLLERIGFVGRRLGTPTERFLAHTIGVTELVTSLIEEDRASRLELLSWEGEPSCWRAFLGSGGSRTILKPDLSLRLGAGSLYERRYFIEYDLATEAAGSLTTKLKRHLAYRASGTELADHGGDPKVLWLVPDARRARYLRRLIECLPEHDRDLFDVTEHHDAIALLGREVQT